MQRISVPTGAQNATSRLFLRFMLCYWAVFFLALPLLRDRAALPLNELGAMQLAAVALALLGAFLTVSKPYLLLLTACKACLDASLLFWITQSVQNGALGLLQWNAAFFLTAFSAVLLALAASLAQWFSFSTALRDVRLLFSRSFGRFLLRASLYLAAALLLYFLWPQLCDTLDTL